MSEITGKEKFIYCTAAASLGFSTVSLVHFLSHTNQAIEAQEYIIQADRIEDTRIANPKKFLSLSEVLTGNAKISRNLSRFYNFAAILPGLACLLELMGVPVYKFFKNAFKDFNKPPRTRY